MIINSKSLLPIILYDTTEYINNVKKLWTLLYFIEKLDVIEKITNLCGKSNNQNSDLIYYFINLSIVYNI